MGDVMGDLNRRRQYLQRKNSYGAYSGVPSSHLDTRVAASLAPIVHSSVRAKVEWGEGKGGGLAALAGQPVVLKFAIEEAHLFTFQFE